MKRVILVLSLLINISIGNAAKVAQPRKAVPDSVYICESAAAYAYHAYTCRGLARCTHVIVKISKAEAVKRGYRACKICYR